MGKYKLRHKLQKIARTHFSNRPPDDDYGGSKVETGEIWSQEIKTPQKLTSQKERSNYSL